MYQHKKHYTLEEARASIPLVEPLVEKIVGLKQRLDAKGYDIYRHRYFGGMGPNGEKDYPPELERLVGIVRELGEEGILVKGVDEGLIDFWHRIRDGYRGRKSIDDL